MQDIIKRNAPVRDESNARDTFVARKGSQLLISSQFTFTYHFHTFTDPFDLTPTDRRFERLAEEVIIQAKVPKIRYHTINICRI